MFTPQSIGEHHFPAIWSLKTALGVWFAAAEANAPAQAVFPSLSPQQLISISHISLLCCSPALPCAELSSNPAPPAQARLEHWPQLHKHRDLQRRFSRLV